MLKFIYSILLLLSLCILAGCAGKKPVVEPATAVKYCDRKANFPYKITTSDLCYKLFVKYGFTWGGAWRTMKDYQHFEYKLR